MIMTVTPPVIPEKARPPDRQPTGDAAAADVAAAASTSSLSAVIRRMAIESKAAPEAPPLKRQRSSERGEVW